MTRTEMIHKMEKVLGFPFCDEMRHDLHTKYLSDEVEELYNNIIGPLAKL